MIYNELKLRQHVKAYNEEGDLVFEGQVIELKKSYSAEVRKDSVIVADCVRKPDEATRGNS